MHHEHESSTWKITIPFYCLVAYLINIGRKYIYENISISVFAANILTMLYLN